MMKSESGAGMLFSPICLGDLELSNRIIMAPCTRNRAGPGNVPGDITALYYGQRASAGLIISEASQVSPQGVGYPGTPGIHTPEQVAGWRKVVDAVHDRGGRMFIQLWHVGRISHPSMQPGGDLPVAPSAVKPEGQCMTYRGLMDFVTPRALETGEIPGIVAQFCNAAKNARDAGFDGVEIHAANGYLIDQFLRDGSNRRSDQYGGSVANRARLLLEVTAAVAGAWEPHRVGVRLSPTGTFNDMLDSDPLTTFTSVARALNRFDLAYLHVIEDAANRDDAIFSGIRSEFSGHYMANGGYDHAQAEARVAGGRAAMVSFGKFYIANPDLPERFARNAPMNEPDPASFYGGDEKGYTDYPYLSSA